MKLESQLTEQKVRAALELAGGHRGKAAELLQVNRVTLWRAIKRHGIQPTWSTKEAA
jgi:transcriptional regulator of acetoin/glycerol metabolism